ncbi:MAG: hypothetical protein H6Q11_1613, partial [Acidobacteria bacterium]|nr:hypothetical protein [Acidobacteriota bacterium]
MRSSIWLYGDQGQQAVHVGGAQLLQLPIGEQVADHRVLIGHLLQHRGIGRRGALRGLLQHGQAQPVEEHLAQLLGGIDVERLPGRFVHPALQRGQTIAQVLPELAQVLPVHQDPRLLHAGEHPHQRQLHLPVQLEPALLLEPSGERLHQPGHGQGPPAGSLQVGLLRPELESPLSLAASRRLRLRLDLQAEHLGGEPAQVGCPLGRVDQEPRQGGVEGQADQVPAALQEGPDQRLGVVQGLGDLRIGQGARQG